MFEIKAVTYEEARREYLEEQMQKAQRSMKYWESRIDRSRPGNLMDEAYGKASDAGWKYNFYKDALEALENQPKWISVEDKLPEQEGMYIVYIERNKGNAFIGTDHYDFLNHWGGEGWYDGRYVTHWMPFDSLPEPPKEESC